MKKILIFILSAFLSAFAMASTDTGCERNWSPYPTSCLNLPFLHPDNDTRVNLGLLLVDRGILFLAPIKEEDLLKNEIQFPVYLTEDITPAQKIIFLDQINELKLTLKTEKIAANQFLTGEGSRCRSNSENNAQIFLNQLINTDLPDAERQSLAQARVDMLGACDWESSALNKLLPTKINSITGQEFLTYLKAIGNFYSSRFDAAHNQFMKLSKSEQTWLKETATYMIARNALNKSQKDAFDENGLPTLNRVDKSSLRIAEENLSRYLNAYPDGIYFASAKGLMRRVYWLSSNSIKLAAEYNELLFKSTQNQRNVSIPELIDELDLKLLMDESVSFEDPVLLALRDLMWMRKQPTAKLTREILDKQKSLFSKEPRLYNFLKAAFAFYVEGNSDQTLKLIPGQIPKSLDFLSFSEQSLRGQALEAKWDWRSAENLWLQLSQRTSQPVQQQQLQLALAMNYEKNQRLPDVFATNSPIKNQSIRQILLSNIADATLLRNQTQAGINQAERDHALSILLFKELMKGRYVDFVNDFKKSSMNPGDAIKMYQWRGSNAKDGYVCPSILEIATLLAEDSKHFLGLNCLGEFILRNDLDFRLQEHYLGNHLGGTQSAFTGKLFSRLDGYKIVFGSTNASPNDKAYALYRAINCYAPSGQNSCGGADVDLAVRKNWFSQLKNKFPNSSWSKQLKYYW